MVDTDRQLVRLADELNTLISDLGHYIDENKNQKSISMDKNNQECRYIKDKKGNDRIACFHIEDPSSNPRYRKKNRKRRGRKGRGKRLADRPIEKKIINGRVMAPWGNKWLPVCNGAGYPYVEGCYSDASNWSGQPKQCIIENPATPNLASGSLYTCGFLW